MRVMTNCGMAGTGTDDDGTAPVDGDSVTSLDGEADPPGEAASTVAPSDGLAIVTATVRMLVATRVTDMA
jgi:hypothetical protein